MECSKGTSIDGWETARLIARGNHSDIHEIINKENRLRRVAKTVRLPLQLGQDKQLNVHGKLLEVFENEKQLCKLQHDNIVRFLDMELLEKEPSVVVGMELIDGQTLDNFIKIKKPLEEDTISLLANQVCHALCYLHTFKPRAIIHRDINCRTIMVSDDNCIKLIDFGLAVQLVESATDHVTGNPKGDPAFMAPELFLTEGTEDTPYSCASDIWAFGCVIYQMVTGKRPHADCKNMLAIVRRVKNQGAPRLPEGCSEVLKDFYAKCTAKEKKDRESAANLLNHPFLTRRALAGPNTEAEALNKDPNLKLKTDSRSTVCEVYTRTSIKGLCLVINIEKYSDSSRFQVKQNQQNEIEKITSVFEKLGFFIEKKSDPTSVEFWALVDKVVTAPDLADVGSFICCIIGQGSGGSVFSTDGDEIEIRDVLARFRANQCPRLKDKPKLFFIQTEKLPEGQEACSLEDVSFRLPENEFLLCSGATRGSLADAMHEVITDEKLNKQPIEGVVNEMNKRLGLPQVKAGAERFGPGPSTVSSLTKKFYLNNCSADDCLLSSPNQWSDQQLEDLCNCPEKLKQKFGPMEQIPLTIASARGRPDLVRVILKQSPEFGVPDVQGRTAVGWAALKGQKDVLFEFKNAFEHNKDALKTEVNRKDNMSQTPIILASKNDQAEVLNLLVEMGADINCQDALKFTAITYATKLGFEETTSKLCHLGADLTLPDYIGNTPLIWAARCGHKGVLQLLSEKLSKPTDLDYWKHKGERSMNAQEWAKFCEHYECASIVEKCIRRLVNLTSGGVNFERSDGDGNGPGSGDQLPAGSGGREGGEQGAEGGADEPNEPSGGQDDSVTSGPYPMDGINRGIALVINILDFIGYDLPRREGSMVDMSESSLYRCFTTLGFDCRQAQNVNFRFFDGLPLNICTEEELNRSQAIVVCLMSHGGREYIYSHDGRQVALELIYSRFQQCAHLRDKPKLFFIQSCREESNQGRRLIGAQAVAQSPLEDSMYFYSTSQGRLSIRDPDNGGLFTQELSLVVHNNFQPDSEEFTAIIPRVINGVFNRSQGQQVPCCELSIRRPLEFPTLGRRRPGTRHAGPQA